MLFISRSAGLTMPIRANKNVYTPQGDLLRVEPALSVQFQNAGDVPAFAREAVSGLAHWGVGLGHYESGEPEDPFTRCGILDTEIEAERQSWTPEEREIVEQALLRAQSHGTEYIAVSPPAATKPWPKYDDIVGPDAAEQIGFYSDQLGIDPTSVKNYELENLQREDVIAAMDAEIEKLSADIVGVISV